HPTSAHRSPLRLAPNQGLINTLCHHQQRHQPRVRLFEYGLRVIPCESAEHGMRHEPMLAGVIAGPRGADPWALEPNPGDVCDR
ncbi:phenylalanine--tRNA ligase subunit beta, partial [Vibrio parahaemolyticus]|nr:phenylalanine--tRNA ligase subunit beta [Vibrio parahaemolyticus]